MRILITGGGTGGHVAPALAVAETLRRRGPDVELLYVGSAQGLEARLATEAGIPFQGVAVGKLRRSSRGPIGLLTAANIRDALRVPLGIVQAFRAVGRFRPDAVLSTGGYVCVPTVVAAWMRRVPVLTHEQTVTVGLANRIAGRFARRIALTFEGSTADLPQALRGRSFVTGNPVRQAIFAGNRSVAAARFGFDPTDDNLPCLWVTGGAQGSRLINRAVIGAIESLVSSARVLHQCGAGEAAEVEAAWRNSPDAVRSRWRVVPFLDTEAIGDAWAVCDLLLGRSGAGTVTEVCALGKAAVFVPLEPTGGDEQMRNARWLEQDGAAWILRQSECDSKALESRLLPLLADPAERAERARKAGQKAIPDAAERLTDALCTLASNGH